MCGSNLIRNERHGPKRGLKSPSERRADSHRSGRHFRAIRATQENREPSRTGLESDYGAQHSVEFDLLTEVCGF